MSGSSPSWEDGIRSFVKRIREVAQVAADSGDLTAADQNRILCASGDFAAFADPMIRLLNRVDPDAREFATQCFGALLIGAFTIGGTAALSGRTRALLKRSLDDNQAKRASSAKKKKAEARRAAVEAAVLQEFPRDRLEGTRKFADSLAGGVNLRLAETWSPVSPQTIQRVIAKIIEKSPEVSRHT